MIQQARRNAQGGLVNKIKFDLLTTIRKHDQEIDKHASDDEVRLYSLDRMERH